METERRQHLQDIYATDQSARDDFTPQVSSEMMEERKREVRRHQLTSFVLGATVLVLGVALVYVVIREYMDILQAQTAPETIQQEYIPRYSLPTESQWVMDFSRNYGDPKWDGEGERPFNATWLKKASFNVILAEQALETRKYAEAAEYYQNALEILPELEGVKVPLAMAYFQLGKNMEALKLMEDAANADLTFDVLNNLGAACIKAEAYAKGEQYLKRSLELKPAYAEALKNMAILYKKQNKEAEACSAYEQYLDQRPNDTDARYDFALYLTKIGNWELAGEQLRTLTAEVTDVANLYFVLARVENKLGNGEAAVAALQRGVQLTDPKLAMAWMSEEEFDLLRNEQEFQSLMKYVEKGRSAK
ncbi:tetratricopeptide repeat protein [Pontiella sp.]|uniref:tetratricopeptide repeat protein n=1 Tax=Pontiella sp. TaxID=2837462 RepID=UPI003561D5EF